MKPRVLFVSPRPEDAQNLKRMLSRMPLSLEHVKDVRQARAKLLENAYGVILTEATLPMAHDEAQSHIIQTQKQSGRAQWVL